MHNFPLIWVLILFAYGLGSILTAVLVARAFRLPDPRGFGSANPGATNMLRAGDKKAAILTLALDAAKGMAIPALAGLIGLSTTVQLVLVAAALTGHMLPIFYGFKGGKGVATLLGGMVVVAPPVGLVAVGLWILLAGVLKISSLAALVALSSLPILAYVAGMSTVQIVLVSAMAVASLIRHRANIVRLWQGAEKTPSAAPTADSDDKRNDS